ncbi:hypothetical protein F5I97DRAFT_744870 [Phlebopus sp. FC_14]|nr:hypothetical protein F5I97DRAFT_744870 [Phlebopus sp. FC_14]
MSNAQGSFSVHSFPLKPVEQPSGDSSSSSNEYSSQNVVDRSLSSAAGPSNSPVSQPTPIPSSGSASVPNTTTYAQTGSPEELQTIQHTAAGFAACLAADQAAVLYPDMDTPFMDVADVVNRLLPYHVFQQPKEDLKSMPHPYKGKEKAKLGEIRTEIEEARFALRCHKRLQKLHDRFRRAKLKKGMRPSPDDQAYVLAQAILDVERSETAAINAELRSARNELDAIQREKRASAAAQPTVTTFRPTYYPQVAQSQYYRAYPNAYTQPYSAGTQGATTSAFYSTPSTPATAGSTSYTPSPGAIPVQLPVTSLSALHALGIVPVPVTSVPPADQPQPAAVLKGSTSNGAMLSLEINVSLLQSAQMSGLAILLNSLMSRGTAARGAEQTGVLSVAQPASTQREGDGTG